MNKPLIAGNWKMNMLRKEAKDFFSALEPQLKSLTSFEKIDTVIFPPFTLLSELQELARVSGLRIGAQNCHWEVKGAFTGEVSSGMLSDLGIQTVLIGHSERRQYFGETNETVGKRLKAALNSNLSPVVCIGERLEERKAGITGEVISTQLSALLSTQILDSRTVIAYEPVWAIGTGLAATPLEAQEVHAHIRSELTKALGSKASQIRIVYGGSMTAKNVEELLSMPDIDGGLIGGASLIPNDFFALIKAGIARASRL